jgi:uncharacterized protein YraI
VQAQQSGTGWTAQYFNNTNLSGTPIVTQALPGGIGFNLGTNSPAAGVPADGWSARYTSIQTFNAGTYQFIVGSDDGVRVLIDNVLVFDRFIGRTFVSETFQQSFPTTGARTLTVEYFDAIDQAILTFQWTQVSGTVSTPIGATPSVTPFVTLTIPTPTARACTPPLALTTSSEVILIPGVNVRSEASPSSPQLYYSTERIRLRIEGGPVCNGGYQWWQVSGPGVRGWVAEGANGRNFLIPIDLAAERAAGCTTPLRLTVGGDVRLLLNLRVRSAPSTTAPTVTTLDVDTVGVVLEGPSCANNVNWWRIRANGFEGWVAEGYPTDNYLAPASPLPETDSIPGACVVPLSLQAGSRVAIDYRDGVPRTLRAAPTSTSAAIASLINEIALEVIEGPVCAETYNWWFVRVVGSSVTGWIAEGRPGTYWLRVLYY